MSDKTRFDDQRSTAWRAAIVENARAHQSRADKPRKHVALIVGLVLAALVASGGGVAYALSAVLRPATPPLASSTPIQRDTPSVTPAPPTTPPAPSPTRDPADIARGQAQDACRDLAAALDSYGNIASESAWAQALASARQTAQAAAEIDAGQAGLASHITTLAETPLPGPSATDAQKNSYFAAYLPVATDCHPLGVELPTD